jgi:hypothetical protein
MRDTIDMAREAGFADKKGTIHAAYQLKAFEALVRADQREIDAKVCEALPLFGVSESRQWERATLKDCAAAIRARSCPPCNNDCDQGRNCPARKDK